MSDLHLTESLGNLGRGDTVPAFDNRPMDFEDNNMKLKELELRAKNAMAMRSTSSKGFLAKDQQICRICLSEEEPDNLLINPCSCTGSMKYIHETCLREWLEGKKHMKETEVVNSYIWKNLECEICKTSYADLSLIPTLKDGLKEFNILNFKIHEDAKSYMVIESVTNTTSKTIHVINFSL